MHTRLRSTSTTGNAYETSFDLNYWEWLVILAIAISSHDRAFSHVGLVWIIRVVCYVYVRCQKIHDFDNDQVRSYLIAIKILDTYLEFGSIRGSTVIFSLVFTP